MNSPRIIDLKQKSREKRYRSAYYRMSQITNLMGYVLQGVSLAKDKFTEGDYEFRKLSEIEELLFTILNDDLYELENKMFDKCSDEYKEKVKQRIVETIQDDEILLDDFLQHGSFLRRKINIEGDHND